MRSAASVRGHPIHPALIPFPIAFLVGAFAFDLAGRLAGREAWWTTAGWLALAGIATALLAAVPGLMDYVRTVPPRSSGKRRATLHLSVNLGAVALFAIAALMRDAGPPATGQLALEAAGTALLGVGGWLGGALAYRNEIGVDRRYAGAGKWREVAVDALPGQRVRVAGAGDLAVNQMMLVRAGGRRVVLARTDEGYVAFDDRCPHRGGSLAGGAMICGTVQCPWHGSQFDVGTGAVRAGPATAPIRTHAVVETGREVFLTVDKNRDAGAAGAGEGMPGRRDAAGRGGRSASGPRRRSDRATTGMEES